MAPETTATVTPESVTEPENLTTEPADAPETEQPAADGQEATEGDDSPADGDVEGQSDAETFPRAYVEKLRKENADNRVKAKRADELAGRLHASLVAATGKLADPSDLPFKDEHLDNPDALNAAITELLKAKPHLAARRPAGDIGQGLFQQAKETVSLANLLRTNAGL